VPGFFRIPTTTQTRCEGFLDRCTTAVFVIDRQIVGHVGMDERRRRFQCVGGLDYDRQVAIVEDNRCAASCAAASISATTSATASPTKRTRSWASAGRGGTLITESSFPLKCRIGRGLLKPALITCSALNTASTPGLAIAVAVSIRDDLGVGSIRAQEIAMNLAGQYPIGGKSTLSGKEAQVLAPAFKCTTHAVPK
jgi:hypothetical protein